MKDYLKEAGYKRDGKIFTPPVLQLGQFNSVYWIDLIIPEFIWIGELQRKYGFIEGSNLARSISEAALDVVEDKTTWFALQSNYENLSTNKKETIKEELSKLGILQRIQEGFSILNSYYGDFPLNFLTDRNSTTAPNLESFKEFLNTIYDRTTIEANLIQGIALDMVFQSEFKIQINAGLPLASFPKFVDYPKTEISKRVASSIRSTINLLIGNNDITNLSKTWSENFWQRGFEIENCY